MKRNIYTENKSWRTSKREKKNGAVSIHSCFAAIMSIYRDKTAIITAHLHKLYAYIALHAHSNTIEPNFLYWQREKPSACAKMMMKKTHDTQTHNEANTKVGGKIMKLNKQKQLAKI